MSQAPENSEDFVRRAVQRRNMESRPSIAAVR
jgi:hypothetical protein